MKNTNFEKSIKKTLGSRIREERNKHGWTIEYLAEVLDVSSSFLGSVERGERALSIEKLFRVSATFGVTTDSLVRRSLPSSSRSEALHLLIHDISDKEFDTVYHIIQTVREHFKSTK